MDLEYTFPGHASSINNLVLLGSNLSGESNTIMFGRGDNHIKLSDKGLEYRGKLTEDSGEIYHAMMVWLKREGVL